MTLFWLTKTMKLFLFDLWESEKERKDSEKARESQTCNVLLLLMAGC
jgi:hypothetical protein